MKPQLEPAKPIPFNGRPKVNLAVNTKTSFGEDKEYISSEDSKVGGGSNGIPSASLLIPQTVSSSHGCITSSSSNIKTTTNIITGNSSSTSTNTTTTISKNIDGSSNPKVSKNNGLGRKVIEEVGAGISEEDQGCNRMMHHAPEGNGEPSETGLQSSHIGEYNADCNRAGMGYVQNNKPMTWGGWIPVTYGKEDAWRPYVAHPSVHPPQHSSRTPYQYGSPRHLQTPHMITPQSWTHNGWPLCLPHDQSHSLRNTSPTFNHNMNQTLLLPHPAYSPNKNSTYNGTQLHAVNQSQPLAQNHHIMETSCKTSYRKATTAQVNGNSCPPATPCKSSSNNEAGNSTTTLSSKTNSPLSTPSSAVNRKACLSSLAGNGIEQTVYGYVNQQHILIMPYYQYSGSVAPYCSWAAPVVMQWPMAQSPSFHSTPNNSVGMAAQPKGLENSLPHTALTFTPQNEKHITLNSPQAMTPKFKELLSPATNSIPFSKPGRGGHMSYSRNRFFKGQALHSPTYNSSQEILCKQSEQKLEHLKGSASNFPHMFSSTAHRTTMSPSKFPRPLAPSQSQTGPPGKGFSSNSGVVNAVKALAGQEEHYITVPMTPPPTPLPNIVEISDTVENISAS